MAERVPVLYRVVRVLVRHAVRIFYRRWEIVGEEHIPPTGPLLLASNHPNTLIDVLLIGSVVRRRLRFVAKATIMAVPGVGALMRALGAIAVHRRLDGPVDGDQKQANEHALAGCEQVVAEGGAVLVFPEGVSSQHGHRLLKLHTGLARIALGAEHRAPGRVVVVPMGLIYEDPGRFRSAVRIEISAPIAVAPFVAAGQSEDDFTPARTLTHAVREALELDTVHIDDSENEQLISELDLLYGSTIASEAGGRLAASRAIARAVNATYHADADKVEVVRAELTTYREALAVGGVTDEVVRQRSPPHPSLGQDLLYYAGTPLAAWGFVNHVVFYQVPRFAAQRSPLRMEFDATVKLLSGMVSLLSCYALQCWGVGWLLGPAAVAPYLVSLPPSGVVALLWWEGRDRRRHIQEVAEARAEIEPEALRSLERQRAALLLDLDRARVQYLAAQLEVASDDAKW